MFKGASVPINSQNGTYEVEQQRVGISSDWKHVASINSVLYWTTPNGLLGNQITGGYKYRVRARYINVKDENTEFSEYSEASDSKKVQKLAGRPILNEIIASDDQVPTSDKSILAFKVSISEWAGAPIVNYTLQWLAENKCGATDPSQATAVDVVGPGLLNAVESKTNIPFVVTIPALLKPDTRYHVQVRAQVAMSGPFSDALMAAL